MIAFLESILSTIGALLTFLVNVVTGLFQLIQMIPAALHMFSYSIAAMPPVIAVFMTCFVSVSVVYLIVGR